MQEVTSENDWQPIHSLGGKYEMNGYKEVRNAKTHKILKVKVPKGKKLPMVRVYHKSSKSTCRSIQQLFWETHGRIPKTQVHTAVPVTLFKGNEIRYFESMSAAARFLTDKIYYSQVSIARWLWRDRLTEIHGWQVIYHEGGV